MAQATAGRPDDRTTRARLRDAAIELVAQDGSSALSARRVAKGAGVSAGLVTHHFGSMAGLQHECDEHVVAVIREGKTKAMSAGVSLDPLAAVRNTSAGPIVAYLAQRLGESSPAVAELVGEMVRDAEVYIERGVASGMLTPTDEPRRRAAYLMLSSLGSLVLHEHVRRLLGVDLMAADLSSDPNLPAYVRTTWDVIGRGIFTDEFSQQVRKRLLTEEENTHD